jgi:hypothetical protein
MNREPENLLDLLGEDAPSDRMRTRLKQDIAAERQRSLRRRGRRQGGWAIAAVLAVVVGFGAWRLVPGPDGRSEATRTALVSESALQRARGARATAELAALTAEVRERLETLLRGDPDLNVRLAAIHALAQRGKESGVRAMLLEALTTEQAPILQAHLVRALQQGSQGFSPEELERLRALDGLDGAARSRLTGS